MAQPLGTLRGFCGYGTGSRIGSARIERRRPPRDAAVVSGHPPVG
jgi:hypothetical protein